MKWDTPGIHYDAGLRWDQPSLPIGTGGKKMIYKLQIGFEKLSNDAFLGKAQRIDVALNMEPALTLLKNPWPDTYPSRTDISTAYTDFETAYDAAREGGKTAIDTRDQKRAVLEKCCGTRRRISKSWPRRRTTSPFWMRPVTTVGSHPCRRRIRCPRRT